jgi:hypothetical protein
LPFVYLIRDVLNNYPLEEVTKIDVDGISFHKDKVSHATKRATQLKFFSNNPQISKEMS